jgi:hypothetical protein
MQPGVSYQLEPLSALAELLTLPPSNAISPDAVREYTTLVQQARRSLFEGYTLNKRRRTYLDGRIVRHARKARGERGLRRRRAASACPHLPGAVVARASVRARDVRARPGVADARRAVQLRAARASSEAA